jgi:REP element-mobilizing transposase RayT
MQSRDAATASENAMGSFTRLTYHVVFATKYRTTSISHPIQERLYEYVGGILRAKKGHLIEIGGIADHIHIMAEISASIAVADVIRDVKANSSKWMNEQLEIKQFFEWQKGYGAFTVSYSLRDTVQNYIQRQEEHHQRKTFQEEYIELLKRHNIPFQLEYLFEDEHHG